MGNDYQHCCCWWRCRRWWWCFCCVVSFFVLNIKSNQKCELKKNSMQKDPHLMPHSNLYYGRMIIFTHFIACDACLVPYLQTRLPINLFLFGQQKLVFDATFVSVGWIMRIVWECLFWCVKKNRFVHPRLFRGTKPWKC